jgi:hypothetical protein
MIDVESVNYLVRSSVIPGSALCNLMVCKPTSRERWHRTHIDLVGPPFDCLGLLKKKLSLCHPFKDNDKGSLIKQKQEPK